jgi:hypothetical protein
MSLDKFNKVERGVFQILRLTQLNELKWTRCPVPASLPRGTDAVFINYFEAQYLGKWLGLFQERHRTSSSDVDARWGERIGLVLLNAAREVEFEFPLTPFTQDLFNAVRIKESNVEEFLDALIQSEP